MKILIYGSGGVGGYFGGKLADSGANVTFLARGKHFIALKEKGLLIKSIKENIHIKNVKAVQSVLEAESPELVLLGVKAWQVKDAAKELSKIKTDKMSVIPLQNGIMAAEELRSELGHSVVLDGICKIFSKIEEPGIIQHIGFEPIILFGENDNSVSERCKKIQSLFINADFKAKIPDDIHAEVWTKFLYICTSGLCAVTGTNLAVLNKIAETRKMLESLLSEIFEISLKAEIKMKPDIVSKTLAFIDTLDEDSTSSLQRDIMEGKASELEYQNGTVVKLAAKYGVSAPANTFIYSSLLPLEMKARG